jgi:hypothetical protein
MSGRATEMRKLIRKAKKDGWSVTQTRRHYILTWKEGGRVTASLSPSCKNAFKNVIADMRRVEKTLHKG